MAFTFTNADSLIEFDVVEMPSFTEFTLYDKPIRSTNMEIWLAPRAYPSSDGVMDALPVEIYAGEWLDDGTFHRASGNQQPIQAVLVGRFGDSKLKYAPR